MATKATHSGTCQCCGALQKLPGGVLSIHGYTVRWNVFNGTCQGTAELPFEQSIGLIERFITSALVKKATIQAFQEELREVKPTEPKGWYREYRGEKHMTHQWCEVELSFEGQTYAYGEVRSYRYVGHDRKLHRLPGESKFFRNYDILDVAHQMNKRYAQALQADIDQIDRYVAWQRERIKDWAPKALIPVKGAA